MKYYITIITYQIQHHLNISTNSGRIVLQTLRNKFSNLGSHFIHFIFHFRYCHISIKDDFFLCAQLKWDILNKLQTNNTMTQQTKTHFHYLNFPFLVYFSKMSHAPTPNFFIKTQKIIKMLLAVEFFWQLINYYHIPIIAPYILFLSTLE